MLGQASPALPVVGFDVQDFAAAFIGALGLVIVAGLSAYFAFLLLRLGVHWVRGALSMSIARRAELNAGLASNDRAEFIAARIAELTAEGMSYDHAKESAFDEWYEASGEPMP